MSEYGLCLGGVVVGGVDGVVWLELLVFFLGVGCGGGCLRCWGFGGWGFREVRGSGGEGFRR